MGRMTYGHTHLWGQQLTQAKTSSRIFNLVLFIEGNKYATSCLDQLIVVFETAVSSATGLHGA